MNKGLGYASGKLSEQKGINRIHHGVNTSFPQESDSFFRLQEIMQWGRHHRHTGTSGSLTNPIESSQGFRANSFIKAPIRGP